MTKQTKKEIEREFLIRWANENKVSFLGGRLDLVKEEFLYRNQPKNIVTLKSKKWRLYKSMGMSYN